MADIVYVDGLSRAKYLVMTEDGVETEYPDAFHLSITIPAERREDIDRNDACRRELTAILEAAIASTEG